MHNTIKITAPAKLNLFLHVNARMTDGYHHIQTLFQPINWLDYLEFSLRKDKAINLKIRSQFNDDHRLLRAEDNLVYKAAALLQGSADIPEGVDIHLTKTIPVGAGLGGGSADAATTLYVLNQLWQLNLPLSVLLDFAVQLGADVPALLYRASALAEGRGEKLYTIRLPRLWFLVFMPDCHCSTEAVFASQELTRDTQIITISDLEAQITGNVRYLSELRNDCQAAAGSICSAIGELIDKTAHLVADNFSKPRLTGTGAAVFMMFTFLHQAEAVQRQFLREYPDHGLLDLRLVESLTERGMNQITENGV